MDRGRDTKKGKQKSRRKNRYPLAERHRLGISATARAAAKLKLKLERRAALAAGKPAVS